MVEKLAENSAMLHKLPEFSFVSFILKISFGLDKSLNAYKTIGERKHLSGKMATLNDNWRASMWELAEWWVIFDMSESAAMSGCEV